ncbi:hypothetical protein ACNJQJ_21460, partial [Mycobacterium tuberculosis]
MLAGRSVDHTGRYRGRASALVRPGSAEEVAEVLRVWTARDRQAVSPGRPRHRPQPST